MDVLHPTVAAAIAPGDVIAERYVVRTQLGAGGMGAVYRVLDRDLDEEVALKVLHEGGAWSADAVTRFRREVKLARRVTHPNVARTYDLGRVGKLFFLTMELIEGGSLGQRMQAPVPLTEALRITTEVARGLAAAHAQGVVHRDLKPDNVMLAGERVAITDFGVARGEGDALATSGGVVGTPAYMAPEQLGAREIDGRADVYALGIVLFEMLTGALPFHGDTPFAMAAARLGTPPPDPRSLASSVPEGVARLVLDALALRREDRPDAQTLAERIDGLRGARPAPRPLTPSSLASIDIPLHGGARALRVEPLDATPDHAALAHDLARAVSDAIASERGVRLVTSGGDVVVGGEVRAAGSRVRVRLRATNPSGAIVWSSRIEGDTSDPFTLEDQAVQEVVRAVRTRIGQRSRPRNDALHERWEAANDQLGAIDPATTRSAVAALEQLHREDPTDATVMASLALGLMHLWLQAAGAEPTLAARAEELAMRALDADPQLADACYAMARLRFVLGDLRAGVRGYRETLALAPMHAGAHFSVAQVLCDVGQLDESLRRYELAARLGSAGGAAQAFLLRALYLAGREAEGKALIARARGTPHMHSLMSAISEVCAWNDDRALTAEVVAQIHTAPRGGPWEHAVSLLEAEARGDHGPSRRPASTSGA
jgi:serine/threonine-protein kinase